MTFSEDNVTVPAGGTRFYGPTKLESLEVGVRVTRDDGKTSEVLEPGKSITIDKYGRTSPPLPEEGLTEVRYNIVSH